MSGGGGGGRTYGRRARPAPGGWNISSGRMSAASRIDPSAGTRLADGRRSGSRPPPRPRRLLTPTGGSSAERARRRLFLGGAHVTDRRDRDARHTRAAHVRRRYISVAVVAIIYANAITSLRYAAVVVRYRVFRRALNVTRTRLRRGAESRLADGPRGRVRSDGRESSAVTSSDRRTTTKKLFELDVRRQSLVLKTCVNSARGYSVQEIFFLVWLLYFWNHPTHVSTRT